MGVPRGPRLDVSKMTGLDYWRRRLRAEGYSYSYRGCGARSAEQGREAESPARRPRTKENKVANSG
jgi:hypothetical protein